MTGIKKIRKRRDLQYFTDKHAGNRHKVLEESRYKEIKRRRKNWEEAVKKHPFWKDITPEPLDPKNLARYPALPSPEEEYHEHLKKEEVSEEEPFLYFCKEAPSIWFYKRDFYKVSDLLLESYNDEEIKLLIIDHFDKERRRFERLKKKFVTSEEERDELKRPRIPEEIRITVWQRDEGKCARCGSRENLEYDHIVPISKGGSNTLRNIELLCEECNRSKSDKIGG